MKDRNENRPGYKKTKIGWLPNSWLVHQFSKYLKRKSRPVDVELNSSYQEIGIRSHGRGIFHKDPVLGAQIGNKSVFWLHSSALIFNIVFAWEQAVAVTGEQEVGKIASHRFPMYVPKSNTINVEYLRWFFLTQRGKYSLGLASPGGAGRNKTLGQKDLSQLLIPIPPRAEQLKIAEILSSWECSINQVKRLIFAKKKHKKALTQRLFEGTSASHWKAVALSKAFLHIKRDNASNVEDILSITANVGFVHQSEKFRRVISGENLKRYILLKRGEFAYNKGNSKSYPQGCVYMLEEYEHGAVPNVYLCFKPKTDEIVGQFYKYYFESGRLNRQLSRIINTGVRNDGLLNLNPGDFFNLSVHIPPIDEQHRMAEVFSTVDRELFALQKDLAALEKQKRGLMQKLLTGEVRVIV